MAGIVYEFVKKYEDRFIYMSIKYTAKNFSPTTSSNKITTSIAPIEEMENIANEYGFKVPSSSEEEEAQLQLFANVCRSQFKMAIDITYLTSVLNHAQIGQEYKDIKKNYKELIRTIKKTEGLLEKQKIKEQKAMSQTIQHIEEYYALKDKLRKTDDESEIKRIKKELKNIIEFEREERKRRVNEVKAREYDVFCAFIGKPVIRKSIESPEGVFDFIDVDVGLSMLAAEEEIEDLIKKYKKRIDADVIESIRTNKKYARFHVPIGFIKIDNVVYDVKGRTLHYLLSLKNLSSKNRVL